MKIEAVLTKKPNWRFAEKTIDKNVCRLYILTGVMALGIVCGIGVYLCRRSMFAGSIAERILSFQTNHVKTSFASRFLGFLLSDALLFSLLLLCGGSVFGVWTTYPLVFLKASGIGALACYYMQNVQAQGIGVYFITVLPGKCFLILVLLMMGQNCIYTSAEIRRSILQDGSRNNRVLTLFALRSTIAGCILFAGDLCNALLPQIFSGGSS